MSHPQGNIGGPYSHGVDQTAAVQIYDGVDRSVIVRSNISALADGVFEHSGEMYMSLPEGLENQIFRHGMIAKKVGVDGFMRGTRSEVYHRE
jgi:hypothetical protein